MPISRTTNPQKIKKCMRPAGRFPLEHGPPQEDIQEGLSQGRSGKNRPAPGSAFQPHPQVGGHSENKQTDGQGRQDVEDPDSSRSANR